MSRRIFVVDDEKRIADTLATILNKSGYEALAFYSAESALAKCDSICPELVISDVVMPGMSGLQMAVLFKARHPECKILLFSGQAATANLLEDARTKGYDFELLAKPIHPSDLLAKIGSEDLHRLEAGPVWVLLLRRHSETHLLFSVDLSRVLTFLRDCCCPTRARPRTIVRQSFCEVV